MTIEDQISEKLTNFAATESFLESQKRQFKAKLAAAESKFSEIGDDAKEDGAERK